MTTSNTAVSTKTISSGKILMSDIFDYKKTMYIHIQPDADAIFGNWCRMLTLAANDPEGYVRLQPNLSMNAKDFALYFHRPLPTVEKTIKLLEQMNLITVRDGFIKVNACAAKKAQALKSPSSFLQKEEALAANYRKTEPANQEPLFSEEKATAPIYKETYPARNKPGMIPFDELPPASQHILTYWNKLPLIKMTGLYPPLETRLEELLQYHGENNIINAICIISHCPFLLNKAENSTGWFITFKWMLEDNHLESILQGDYLDRNDPLREELQEKLQPR